MAELLQVLGPGYTIAERGALALMAVLGPARKADISLALGSGPTLLLKTIYPSRKAIRKRTKGEPE